MQSTLNDARWNLWETKADSHKIATSEKLVKQAPETFTPFCLL